MTSTTRPARPYVALPVAPAGAAVAAATRHLARQLAAVVLVWLWQPSTRRFARAAFDRLAVACAAALVFVGVRLIAELCMWIDAVVVPFLTAAGVAAQQL